MEAALDGLVNPTVITRPVRDADGDVVDLALTYANPAAAAWGVTVGAGLAHRPGPESQASIAQLLKVHASGEPLELSSIAASRRGGVDRFIDLRVVRLDDDLVVGADPFEDGVDLADRLGPGGHEGGEEQGEKESSHRMPARVSVSSRL